MKTSKTKYTTIAAICVIAVVVATTVLAGCEQGVSTPGENQGTDWSTLFDENTIKQFQELKNKPAGIYPVKVTGTIEYYYQLVRFLEDLELPANVLIDLDLSGISTQSSHTIGGFNHYLWCKNFNTVTLPSFITTLGDSAFTGSTNLKEIKGIEQVTSIGENVFSGCTKLETITLNDQLKIIEERAFYGCTSLKEITLPNSINTIGSEAFSGCTSLTTIKAEGEYTSSGGEGIHYDAFSECNSLKSVTIPKSIETVDGFDKSRTKAEYLTSVTLQEGNKTIAYNAFGDTGLAAIEIPASVTSIELSAFVGCDKLTSITFKDTTGWKKKQDSQTITVTEPSTNAQKLRTFADDWAMGIYKSE